MSSDTRYVLAYQRSNLAPSRRWPSNACHTSYTHHARHKVYPRYAPRVSRARRGDHERGCRAPEGAPRPRRETRTSGEKPEHARDAFGARDGGGRSGSVRRRPPQPGGRRRLHHVRHHDRGHAVRHEEHASHVRGEHGLRLASGRGGMQSFRRSRQRDRHGIAGRRRASAWTHDDVRFLRPDGLSRRYVRRLRRHVLGQRRHGRLRI